MVTVGAGLTGGIVAAELTKAGLNVLSLERGHMQSTENFNFIHDPSGLALPYDFEIQTLSKQRYGNKLGNDYTLQDWGMTYKDMESYYDRFEKTCGVSGEPNPLAEKMRAFRSNPYPQEPLKILKCLNNLKAQQKVQIYTLIVCQLQILKVAIQTLMVNLAPCQYCAYCECFGCEYGAKASPLNTVIPKAMSTGKYTIRTYSNVTQILKKDGKVMGVKFVDTRTMKEYIQPADIVVQLYV